MSEVAKKIKVKDVAKDLNISLRIFFNNRSNYSEKQRELFDWRNS